MQTFQRGVGEAHRRCQKRDIHFDKGHRSISLKPEEQQERSCMLHRMVWQMTQPPKSDVLYHTSIPLLKNLQKWKIEQLFTSSELNLSGGKSIEVELITLVSTFIKERVKMQNYTSTALDVKIVRKEYNKHY